ncbi:hypothetical protein D0Z07_0532 [Hyphodiscus hymeniophilus]|uniref:SnoaL-like domain-containing protein n=1 Tax=Hyphodiscus hymeniophilus TaxID=353542 RepID=A0A9P6VSZ5_9HELO|nr:hypothetical protein D0Z07_0532 [Hyphodiscus hymeniophilus]
MKLQTCASPLACFFSFAVAQDAYNAIRNTLAHYPLAIDEKRFSALSLVFTPDAVANYSAPLNVLTGLPMIEDVLEADLRVVSTQHSYGTQLIEVYRDGTADTVT